MTLNTGCGCSLIIRLYSEDSMMMSSAVADAIPVNLQGPALKPCTAIDTFSFGRHIYLLSITFNSSFNLVKRFDNRFLTPVMSADNCLPELLNKTVFPYNTRNSHTFRKW